MIVNEKIIEKLSIGSYGFFWLWRRIALEYQFQPSVSELGKLIFGAKQNKSS